VRSEGRGAERKPAPVYLSTPEQFGLALITVAGLLGLVLPWQLGATGPALWLPVVGGAAMLAVGWALGIRAVLRRARKPASRPRPEVSRRRRAITVVAFLIGVVAISARLLLFD